MFEAGPNSSSFPPMEMALEWEEAPMSRISGVVRAMAVAAAIGAGIAHDPTVIAKYVGTLVLVVLLV